MPHSIEARTTALGAILTNNEVYDRVSQIISASHFYEPVHARIFELCAARITKNTLASPVTIASFRTKTLGLKNWVERSTWPVLRPLQLQPLPHAIMHR